MTRFPMEVGRVVTSRAGRDAGRIFVILQALDAEYVSIADGCLRKVDRPKKKKIKHLHAHPGYFSNIPEKLNQGQPLLDAEVRKCLEDAGYARPKPPRKEG
ncbi:MAG: KOW domain-containing RNA-binding protein [Clostridia bacterium]